MNKIYSFIILVGLSAFSCSREDVHAHDDNESITSVKLTFTPVSSTSGDDEIEATWKSIGTSTVIDDIELKKDTEYDMSVQFLNDSGIKKTDLTEEIEEEGDSHLIIVKSIPADLMSINAKDKDSKGRRLGLKNRLKTKNGASSGIIKVVLRHQPPVNGKETKNGIDETIGSVDADVDFKLYVK